MTGWRLFHLKNEMLAANVLANFIGAELVQSLLFKAEAQVADSLFENRLVYLFDVAFTPFAFILATTITLIYEQSIRQYLNARSNRIPISPELESKARRKLLNEPFVLIAIDLSLWLLAAGRTGDPFKGLPMASGCRWAHFPWMWSPLGSPVAHLLGGDPVDRS